MALAIVATASVAASGRGYQPPLDNSQWEVAPHNPLRCHISQEIPFYGIATFMQHAGKKPAFKIDVERGPNTKGEAYLLSSPPVWVKDYPIAHRSTIPLFAGRQPVRLPSSDTRWMIAQLERGWQPTFQHNDWSGTGQEVLAKLSAINFRTAFADYLVCLRQLLPYGYDDIKLSTIYYGGGSSNLSKKDRELLSKIVRYVEVDPEVNRIVMRGYSDSVGTRRGNYLLSINRLRAIEAFFLGRGVDENKIDSTAFGERNPAASNRTAEGRAKNRRVTIFLRK